MGSDPDLRHLRAAQPFWAARWWTRLLGRTLGPYGDLACYVGGTLLHGRAVLPGIDGGWFVFTKRADGGLTLSSS